MTRYLGVATDELSAETISQVQKLIDTSIAAGAPQMIINQSVVEGQTVTIPNTNMDVTLNLLTGGASLNLVHVVFPGNANGRVGQRIFVNSNGQIAQASFTSAITLNNPDYMFNAGDNCVYYRNAPSIISRLTS